MSAARLIVLMLLLLAAPIAASATDMIYLTVAYCNDVFSTKGAVVAVNASSGRHSIIDRFALGDQVLGCAAQRLPAYLSDVRARTPHLGEPWTAGRRSHLSWGDDWGALWTIDIDRAILEHIATSKVVPPPSGEGRIFDGFTNFALGADRRTYVGLTPHVTREGFCSNGCFQLGTQNIGSGLFKGLGALPFRSVGSNTKFFDVERGIYFAQGSYPLAPEARCSSVETDLCTFAVNATSGAFIRSVPSADFHVYHFEDTETVAADDSSVLAWGFGFQDHCSHTLNSYAFARVFPDTGRAELVACIADDAPTVRFNPSVGCFSSDNSIFATSSGNTFGATMEKGGQLLVYDATSGKALLESELEGLPRELGADRAAPFVMVWGVAVMPPAASIDRVTSTQSSQVKDLSNDTSKSCPSGWRSSTWTAYESYPRCCKDGPHYDPEAPTEECDDNDGCSYQGAFAYHDCGGENGRCSLDWVKTHDLVSFYSIGGEHKKYKDKKIRILAEGRSVEVRVVDTCGDGDCGGCCTRNAKKSKDGFLVDMEYYTVLRHWPGIKEPALNLFETDLCWQSV